MTEDEARQVLLLQSRETAPPSTRWSSDDRVWATRQAVAVVGEDAAPERFVVARAALALQRLLPRDAAAQRWLSRHAWHPAWAVLAALLGFIAGLAVDQLGPPQRVNLLAPAVWVVVAWNAAVYLSVLWPWPTGSLRRVLARWGRGGDAGVSALWAEHATPLGLARAAAVLHGAAATLALGLVAGLYLRGLVLDYRAGWQSTFLDTAQVQALLGALLAPASALTGIAVPDVAPLRVGPDGIATASAAPWIHLHATTLALAVVLPRLLLALFAGWRAKRLARRFPLPLDTPYFESLHPLMRPGTSRVLRLLWAAPPDLAPVTLLGHRLGAAPEPLTLLVSPEGDELRLHPAPDAQALQGALAPVPVSLWQRLAGAVSAPSPLKQLRADTDAVLFVTVPGALRPAWLGALQRPVVVLVDAPAAEPPALPLRRLADGWLPDQRWLRALHAALDGDVRVQRLIAAWAAQQQALLDEAAAELAASLGRIAAARAPLVEDGLLARRSEAEAAQQALAVALEEEWRASGERLAARHGRDAAQGAEAGTLPAAAALRKRVGEGSAAMVGGVVTGALAGLKADVLSGGLTMGAGAVAGGLLGALTAAGVARGVNVVRGTDRSFAAWDADALGLLAHSLLQRWCVLSQGATPQAAAAALQPAFEARQSALAPLWKGRGQRFDDPGEAERLAAALKAPLAEVLRDALARLHAQSGAA